MMIPHFTEITTYHKWSIFRLLTNTKKVFFLMWLPHLILKTFRTLNDSWQVFNGSYFKNNFRFILPNGNNIFKWSEQLNKLRISIIRKIMSILNQFLKLFQINTFLFNLQLAHLIIHRKMFKQISDIILPLSNFNQMSFQILPFF